MSRQKEPGKAWRLNNQGLWDVRRKMPMFDSYNRLFQAMWNEGTLTIAMRDMLRLKSASIAHCEF